MNIDDVYLYVDVYVWRSIYMCVLSKNIYVGYVII